MSVWLGIGLGLGAAAAAVWAHHRWAGFAAQRPADYADQGPALDIRTHLNGPMACEGVIYGPLGRVDARFVADMQADWQGNTGILREDFRYSSGTRQTREWRLTLDESGGLTAEADDLLGPGTGRQAGPALCLRYRIRLPQSAGGHVLDTTDWMYLTANGAIVNRSQFRKYGVKVAELVATMRRKDLQ